MFDAEAQRAKIESHMCGGRQSICTCKTCTVGRLGLEAIAEVERLRGRIGESIRTMSEATT